MRITLLSLLALSLFFACKSEPKAPPAQPLTVEVQAIKLKDVVKDSSMVEIEVDYPTLTGGPNAAATAIINDSIRSAMYGCIGAPLNVPVPAAFDSALVRMREQMKMDEPPIPGMDYKRTFAGKVAANTPRWISLEMNWYEYMGAAHGMYSTVLESYDLNTGKQIALTEIISDTTAFQPVLEKAYLEAKQKQMEDPKVTLKDILYDDVAKLPINQNYCLTKEGIRFNYQPYEVAAYALGETDVLVTWEQLGNLADKKKWME